MPVEDVPASTAGRKRDPSVEPRVYRAAMRLYARDGLAGVSFDTVAREAGVGKPALYRRWGSREEMLVRAFDTLDFPSARDCGSLREDMLDYAYQWVEWYLHPDYGLAVRRLVPDSRHNAFLRELTEQIISNPRVAAARDITRRAVARGELPAGVRSSDAVELLSGAMMIHSDYAPDESRTRLYASFARYAQRIVDVIIAGLSAQGGQPGSGQQDRVGADRDSG